MNKTRTKDFPVWSAMTTIATCCAPTGGQTLEPSLSPDPIRRDTAYRRRQTPPNGRAGPVPGRLPACGVETWAGGSRSLPQHPLGRGPMPSLVPLPICNLKRQSIFWIACPTSIPAMITKPGGHRGANRENPRRIVNRFGLQISNS